MSIRFACPKCASVLKIADRKAGSEVTCPKCSQRIIVPAPDLSPRPGILVETGPALSLGPDDNPTIVSSPSPPFIEPPSRVQYEAVEDRTVNAKSESHHSEPQDLPDDDDDDGETWYRQQKRKRILVRRWRITTLSALAISLVLFFVPWVNITVLGKGNVSLSTQSGFQLIFAGDSPSALVKPFVKTLEEEENRKLRQQGLDPAKVRMEYVVEHGVFRLIVYPLGLGIAAALVFFSKPTSRNLCRVGGVLLGTWLIAFVPFAWSSPTEDAIIATLVKEKGILLGIATSSFIGVHYTTGFSVALWVMVLTILGQVAFLVLVAEPGSIRRTWKAVADGYDR